MWFRGIGLLCPPTTAGPPLKGPTLISPAVLAVLALATYRGTRLAVHDTILTPAHLRVHAWSTRRPDSRVRRAVMDLLSCIYCMGWWIGGAFLAVWLLATGGWADAPVVVHGVEWFAVAGGGALLSSWDDTRNQA